MLKGLVECRPNLIPETNGFCILSSRCGWLQEVEGDAPSFGLRRVEKKFTLGLMS
jgi:hypothetical protein